MVAKRSCRRSGKKVNTKSAGVDLMLVKPFVRRLGQHLELKEKLPAPAASSGLRAEDEDEPMKELSLEKGACVDG